MANMLVREIDDFKKSGRGGGGGILVIRELVPLKDYDLNGFKSSINRHLLTHEVLSKQISCFNL